MTKEHDMTASCSLQNYSEELVKLEDVMNYLLEAMENLAYADTESRKVDMNTLSIIMAMHFIAGASQNNWPEVADLLDKATDEAKYGTARKCVKLVYDAYQILCSKLKETVAASYEGLTKLLNKFGL